MNDSPTTTIQSPTVAMMPRTLLIEDEPKTARALQEGLGGEGFQVVVASTGEDGFFRASAEQFDLVLLDLMLPGRDGLEILGTLRRGGFRTPVLVVTARDSVEDRVAGFEQGADDYLPKPFALPELVARMRALLRRGRSDGKVRLSLADLEADLVTRQVRRSGVELDLTAREHDLLVYLLRHSGSPVTRDMLARDVWKEPVRATPLDNVIDVHISRLRKKVDQGFPVRLVHTVRGVGFMLREFGP